jgi:hypothetical protein
LQLFERLYRYSMIQVGVGWWACLLGWLGPPTTRFRDQALYFSLRCPSSVWFRVLGSSHESSQLALSSAAARSVSALRVTPYHNMPRFPNDFFTNSCLQYKPKQSRLPYQVPPSDEHSNKFGGGVGKKKTTKISTKLTEFP